MPSCAPAHRLTKAGIEVKTQHPLKVYDEDGTIIGEYFADLLVEGRLIVELKACRTTSSEHVAQIIGYLKSSRVEDGLLINFGSYKFEIKKYVLNHKPTFRNPTGLNFSHWVLCALLWQWLP